MGSSLWSCVPAQQEDPRAAGTHALSPAGRWRAPEVDGLLPTGAMLERWNLPASGPLWCRERSGLPGLWGHACPQIRESPLRIGGKSERSSGMKTLLSAMIRNCLIPGYRKW